MNAESNRWAIRGFGLNGLSLDEILKGSVRLIHASNPDDHWTGIYLLEGNTLVCTTLSANILTTRTFP